MTFGDRFAHLSPLKRALLAVESMQAKLDALQRAKNEPIAITGMGCRFPGGVTDPEGFWALLRGGIDAITETPVDRWNAAALYDPTGQAPGKMATRWGGYLSGVDQFDPQFFGIAPREAHGMDPQQRLLLEVCWEALERAGQPPDLLAGTQTGVFVGVISSDYSQLYFRSDDPNRIDTYFGTGTALSITAGRLSYVLGAHGPSLAVDTACSSSLVTVHLAAQSLRAGECDLALAGGVNLVLTPEGTIYFSKVGAMARDGRCKTFDARADGFVRSDGCGIVVLKRLSDAVKDGDPILAVIRGSAVNQDGRSGGLTAPNGPAQQAVIKAALANARVAPDQVDYIEAHGTGTALGDPMEVQALGNVMRAGRSKDSPLAIGSVKTNIGHTEAAAGIAGLMKVVLMLQHQEIAPHLHLEQPSPHIAWDAWPVVVPTTARPWPAGPRLRVAGVSSFGFSGTNAHVVIEEAPRRAGAAAPAAPVYVLPLSARTPAALRAVAAGVAATLRAGVAVADVCYTAGVRRSHQAARLAVVGADAPSLVADLVAVADGTLPSASLATGTAVPGQPPRVVFVCPGQGGQWLGMAEDLLDSEPVFAEAIAACDAALAGEVSWSVTARLRDTTTPWDDIAVVQPALCAVQVALGALWQSWGIRPAAIVGHSMGEVAAAQLAGILSVGDAMRVIARRSALLTQVRGQGAMALVELSVAEATAALGAEAAAVAVAGSNGPRATVLAGGPAALQAVVTRLTAAGVFCRWVSVDVASHSPQVEGLRGALATALADVTPQAATIPLVSTVTGQVCAGPELDAAYWWRNLREPVQFWPVVAQLLAAGHDAWVELSPHPTLGPALQDGVRAAAATALVLPSLRREEASHPVLLRSLAALYTVGAEVDWRARTPHGRVVPLPTYPWQRERFWLDEKPTKKSAKRSHQSADRPLRGEHIELAMPNGTHCWRLTIDLDSVPFLRDHTVRDAVVFPAAAYAEVLLGVARDLFASESPSLEDLQFHEALFLSGGADVELQVIANAGGPATATFQLSSRTAAKDGAASWKRHVSGTLRSTGTSTATHVAAPGERRASGAQSIAAAEHYRLLTDRGLGYGPSFQGVLELWRDTHQAVAKLQVPLVAAPPSDAFYLHPVLLDAAFQTLAAAIPSDASAATYLPVGLTALRQLTAPTGELWAVARLREWASGEPGGARLEGDVWITTADGEVVVEARGLQLQRLEQPAVRKAALDDWLYDLTWEESPIPSGSADSQAGRWLICSDRRGVGSALKMALERNGHTVATVTPGSSFSREGSNAYRVDPSSPTDFSVLLRELAAEQPALTGVVYAWTLDAAATDRLDGRSLEAAARIGPDGVVHLVQALAQTGWRDAPRLWLVTQGAQAVTGASDAVSVAQSPVWGLGRTIAHEHAELRCACVDLDPTLDDGELLARVVALDDREDQIALRGGRRFVARLRRGSVALRAATRPRVPAGDTPFAVEIDTAGILDELTLRPAVRRAPDLHEVEIEVHAAGLNFLDVLSAMGLRPDAALDQPITLGGECAGTVVAVGDGVTDLCVGDAVVALAPGTFRSYVTTPAMFVAVKPSRLVFEDAATLPIAFMTARYALLDLARLSKNESVLIHSAAGGVGLAAVQIAMRLGARIFATAGSEEKRAFLRTLGVPHVMDSRSSSYVEEVRALTDGRGVDVVLNSLSGDAIAQSLSIVAPYGRFVEIGKRDIYQNTQIGLAPFRRNLSYYAVDLARMISERPQLIQSLLASTMTAAQSGELDALPKRVYPVGEVALAFREMAQAKHLGKLVVTLRHRDVLIEPVPLQPIVISADGTYLITGGVGGLGLTIAKWLVSQGARHLVLTSRGGGAAAAKDTIASLEQAGARVVVAPADVADEPQIAELLARIDADLPPLRGVVHAAGVLDDGLILQMTPDRLRRVAAPKIHGAWNLHALLGDRPLDFFVLFSSAASWLGSPGQANYAAANAFLDALAQYRRGSGLPALSINWGPWADVGLAAEQENRGARLAFHGVTSFTPDEGAEAFGALLGYDGAAIAVMALNLRQWRQSYPKAADMPLVAALLRDDAAGEERAKGGDAPLRQALTVAEPAHRRHMLEAHVREQLSAVLRLAPSRIDARTPFRTMGIDSLMALELRNRLEVTVGVTLSATLVWNYPTIAALAPFLAERLGLDLEDPAPGTTGATAEVANAASTDHSELDALSEDELAAMLAQELGALEQAKP